MVDLKPHARDIVSLYLMRGIVGYSYAKWTPLCFIFERLFDDQPAPDPKHFKQKFTREEGCQGTRAVSFVYLRHGTLGDKAWNWGSIGLVNGQCSSPTPAATSTKKYGLWTGWTSRRPSSRPCYVPLSVKPGRPPATRLVARSSPLRDPRVL